jgi:hypothetical protein
VSDECVLAPRTPTPEMIDRGVHAQDPQVSGGSSNANRLRRRARRVYEAMLGATPAEPTEAMVDAYLAANQAYWDRVDAEPLPPIGKWRNGTVKEATMESLRAALKCRRVK